VPSLRIDFYGKACNGWKCMDGAVGIAAGIVRTAAMCASSFHRDHTNAQHGRLFGPASWQSDRSNAEIVGMKYKNDPANFNDDYLKVTGDIDAPKFEYTDKALAKQQEHYYDHFSADAHPCPIYVDPTPEQLSYETDTATLGARHEYLEVAIGKQIVTAVATQGDETNNQYVEMYKLSYRDAGGVWRFYSGSDGPMDDIRGGSTLKGNTGPNAVKKNFVRPFEATAIRFHPMRWAGLSMALRVEVFACLHEFDWNGVSTFVHTRCNVGGMPSSHERGICGRCLQCVDTGPWR